MRPVAEGEALGFEFVAIDAPGEGHRLKADAGDAIDVVDGHAHDVADLVIVDAAHDGGHEHDLDAGLAAVLDAGQLLFHQRCAAGAAVNVVADAVELQVERGQAVRFRLLREFRVGEHDAVGGRLNVGEAHVARHGADFKELRMDGGLAAGELHDAPGHRLLVAQRLQHAAHVVDVGLVEIALHVGIGEADRAGQVAAVGEINIGEHGVRDVHGAQAALLGTARRVGDGRVLEAAIVAEMPVLHLEVELRRREK